ncbi:PadR family transcriptional regulator [Aldersonia sp. NBC_00410]|uniref:PadR family transcriptional regulator n=1 Tax=Aldersonia sp. NBC_00410 TaxID=2975954 RepID=UPI002254C3ED|nr:PadR family transcriptional regulator [Aldersonia sp. NBC_00410]MCX5043703.1 PadR family transcriptional regulator [Aldersonia sp. NBC_00410]
MKPGRRALGPLGIAVLALLFERPMHPYEMVQVLQQRHEDRIVKVRPGSLYHTVGRLEDAKLLRACGTDRAGNRPERTTYEITAVGRAALTSRVGEILGTAEREYPLFPVALAEAHNLTAEDVTRQLRRRIESIEADIAEYDALTAGAESRAVPRVFWIVIGYLRTQAEAEDQFLRNLVEEIGNGDLPWPGTPPFINPSELPDGSKEKSRVNS